MRKNICMIVYSNYLTDARVRREAETLASLPDYKVLVLALKESGSPKTYINKGVEVRELNVPKYRGKSNIKYLLSYIKFMSVASFYCNRLLMNNALSVIHVHNMPNFLVFSGIIPFLFGKKIILDVHDTMIETYSAKFAGSSYGVLVRFLRFEESASCSFAHQIICVNDMQKEALVKRGVPAKKITISINVPDPNIFDYKARIIENTSTNKAFKLIYHGTVAKRLGIDLGIQAVAKLNGSIPGIEFNIMGEGDDLMEFMSLSKELGIHELIHFRNRAPLEEMVTEIEGMDLGVVSNRRNSATELMLPVKMLEYVALRIPVVAPRLRTIEHYFSDDMVFYFDPDSVDSLADAIFDAFTHEDKRKNKAENALRFLEKYGWETHKLDLINLYARL